jgi:hypothetical protein
MLNGDAHHSLAWEVELRIWPLSIYQQNPPATADGTDLMRSPQRITEAAWLIMGFVWSAAARRRFFRYDFKLLSHPDYSRQGLKQNRPHALRKRRQAAALKRR